MAKIRVQRLPTFDMVKSLNSSLTEENAQSAYSNMLFLKVSAEINHQLEELLEKFNLSPGRFTILTTLLSFPDGLIPSHLASELGVTHATISGLIKNMESSGFIRRDTHINDKRAVQIRISEEGEALVAKIIPLWTAIVLKYWGHFKEEECRSINKLLFSIHDRLCENK